MLYEQGDRVVAAQRIGGFLNPTVRKGTPGVVSAVTYHADEITITVAFANGHIQNVSTAQITARTTDRGPGG